MARSGATSILRESVARHPTALYDIAVSSHRFPADLFLSVDTKLLSIRKCFHIALPTALREMWISSSDGAAYTEIFQHRSPNAELILRAFRHYGQWQATA
jgi:hypothetical protein